MAFDFAMPRVLSSALSITPLMSHRPLSSIVLCLVPPPVETVLKFHCNGASIAVACNKTGVRSKTSVHRVKGHLWTAVT